MENLTRMFDPAHFAIMPRRREPEAHQPSRKFLRDEEVVVQPRKRISNLTDMVAPRNLQFVPRRRPQPAPRMPPDFCKPRDTSVPKKSIHELVDLAPAQQEEILKIKREYYAVFDQIIFYYKVLPYYTWLSESLLLLIMDTQQQQQQSIIGGNYYDDQLIAKCKDQLKILLDYIHGTDLSEDDDDAIMLAGIRRKDVFSVGGPRAPTNTIQSECSGRRAQERWIPALDAMEYLVSMRAPPTEEQARFRREQRALKQCAARTAPHGDGIADRVSDYMIFLSSLPLSAYDEMFRLRSDLLTPSAEWKLHDLVTNLAPKKQPAAFRARGATQEEDDMLLLRVASDGGDLSAADKNQFQLDDQSFTLQGMTRLLAFAQEELSKSKAAFEEVYTAVYQAIEFLDETNGGAFSGMAAALIGAVQPYIDSYEHTAK